MSSSVDSRFTSIQRFIICAIRSILMTNEGRFIFSRSESLSMRLGASPFGPGSTRRPRRLPKPLAGLRRSVTMSSIIGPPDVKAPLFLAAGLVGTSILCKLSTVQTGVALIARGRDCHRLMSQSPDTRTHGRAHIRRPSAATQREAWADARCADRSRQCAVALFHQLPHRIGPASHSSPAIHGWHRPRSQARARGGQSSAGQHGRRRNGAAILPCAAAMAKARSAHNNEWSEP